MSEASMADFHQRIMDEFRANDGVVPSLGGSSPLLVLHHVGAHSGAERSTPVRYLPTADGRYVIFGLNGGAPTHPAWYHNLKANPHRRKSRSAAAQCQSSRPKSRAKSGTASGTSRSPCSRSSASPRATQVGPSP